MTRRIKLRLGFVIAFALPMVVAGVVVWATKRGNGTDRLRLENMTRSLVVESVKDLGEIQVDPQMKIRRFMITVRSVSDRSIVAYSFHQQDSLVGKGSVGGIETNGATIGWALLPNRTDVTYFSIPAEGEVVITLSAVLLEDGTGEGDAVALSRLKDNRAGVKTAYQLIAKVLRGAADSNEAVKPDIATQSLRAAIAALSEESVMPNLRRGFYEGKEYVMTGLTELETRFRSNQDLQFRSEIRDVLTRVEETLAKL